MKRICIVRARRTPQGRFLGALAGLSALELAAAAGAALAGIDPALVGLVILGRVLPPDFNTARSLARRLGLPDATPAFTVNMACGSGLKAAALAADAIELGQADVVLCGGTESMSNTPHGLERLRQGQKYGDGKLVDYLQLGLSDPYNLMSMAQTAENLAARYRVDRQTQDAFALRSHRAAVAAQEAGAFAEEIVALPELDHDEHPRADTSLARLAGLKPVLGPEGTVTAGNASGINDGAAMLLLCEEATAVRHGWRPLAYFDGFAQVGCEPGVMGIGPAPASRKLCAQRGLKLGDFDAIEINEAFACQTIACLRELGLPDDEPRVNRQGGAIALGHPVGASGARLLVHLAHQIAGGRCKRALATLCIGGGMGVAATVGQVS